MKFLQSWNAAHAGVDSVQRIGVKCPGQEVLEINYDRCVNGVNRHADYEGPLFTLTCKSPENHEYTRNESVDNQVEGEPCLPRLMRQPVNKLGRSPCQR